MIPWRHGPPVVLSVPHSGRDYPAWLLDLARGGKTSLEPLEDPLVDLLAAPAIAAGAAAVIARAPRALIDCNRSEREVDYGLMPGAAAGSDGGPRARSGLGIVPSRTPSGGLLWKGPLRTEDYRARLATAYRPYHAALAAALDQLRGHHGAAVLIDCHSMPERAPGQPRIVLGDRHGRSAARRLRGAALAIVEEAGFRCGINQPFAGGWIVERHGQPETGIHALQVEIDRSIYLDRRTGGRAAGFDRAASLLAALAAGLGAMLSGDGEAMAAE